MTSLNETALLTATWAGDLARFRVLRASIEASSLSALTHYVIVQSEDLNLFTEFRDRPGIHLLSTEDVLPSQIEQRRRKARLYHRYMGRHLTRISGSLNRLIYWPVWPSYTGWHTQQLCKLMLASKLNCPSSLVVDSDVVVMPNAQVETFSVNQSTTCFAEWAERSSIRGKIKNWIESSELLAEVPNARQYVNVYFDTPFIFDNRIVSLALKALEEKFNKPWMEVFLTLPPRRWSEFGYYKLFLEKLDGYWPVDWRQPSEVRYIYDTANTDSVANAVKGFARESLVQFVVIHSQRSASHKGGNDLYLDAILKEIKRPGWFHKEL